MKSRTFNCSLVWVPTPVAATQVTIQHGLNVTPKGYIVLRRKHAAQLFLGATAWTTTNAYLQSDTGNTLFLVLFIA